MAYKVQFVHVTKKYGSVFVEADNRNEAIKKAKSLSEADFEEREETERILWASKRDWSLLEFLFSKR